MFKVLFKNKSVQLFFVLWLHISLLNLFFVNYQGVVFLWQENSEINTLITHFISALSAALFYIAVTKIRTHLSENKISADNNLFTYGSVIILVLIAFVLF